ncbi:MAG: hypothetical protein OXH04_24090, partial [Acidobacteria bacterium]|nr:hypothetical protein [Acidobacteriota bacterium]
FVACDVRRPNARFDRLSGLVEAQETGHPAHISTPGPARESADTALLIPSDPGLTPLVAVAMLLAYDRRLRHRHDGHRRSRHWVLKERIKALTEAPGRCRTARGAVDTHDNK